MNESTPIKTAMVIDDQEIDQMIYKRILNRSGMVRNVISFLSAEEALEHILNNRDEDIDVIFLDINMPRMSGFQFLEAATAALGNDFVSMVVVMLTTSLNPKDREQAEGFDAVKDFISKPLTEDHINKVAKYITDSH